MFRFIAIFLLLAASAFGATIKLYLKDGDFQLVREYQVQGDRVRYYSTERSDWEEIPLEMVDLPKTAKEASVREEALQADLKAQAEEDAARRAAEKEIASVPQEPGVYYIHGDKLEPIRVAESKIVKDKKRSILKAMSPVPLVPGKSTIELDGEIAAFRIAEDRPNFYFRLSAQENLALIRLDVKKNLRVVETVSTIQAVEVTEETRKEVATFKKDVADLVYRIWPEQPLEPGEYALIQFVEGKANPQVWDFHIGTR